ncbi:XRE family transcriptional regulator [Laspinema olomoucense]|uniref:XRE family transcriptional regulator n=1 Tax=Laspinema olomoucense TaxID=3231600 RepID=UPI0021BB236D|nr:MULTISPECIES: XRE family transcriptional regulator [unclassified Laspinema]MCT7974769.1 XRE family transcriptional regulator [Laspinema sp. D3d]MCT7994881.1 XRE family transcriptional regulator [Laspinema sp. D3c]
MTEEPNLIGFGWVLSLVLFIIILYLLEAGNIENQQLKYDALLGDRMKQLGLIHWKQLAQTAGISTLRLRQIRSGAIGNIPWRELRQLAQALKWSMGELEQQLEPLATPSEPLPLVGNSNSELETQLRQQCQRLREELEEQKSQLWESFCQFTFEELQTLLTNYPTAAEMARLKPDLPAKNLTALFAPLNNLLENWGYEPIGHPWEAVAYNPQFHQGDCDEIQPGEVVYIRFVGYRQGDRILSPAKVSRTLPSGIKPSS